jgi:hypothetical protein
MVFAALFVLLRYLLNDAESGSAVAMRVLASTVRGGRRRPSAGTSCVLLGRTSDADDS